MSTRVFVSTLASLLESAAHGQVWGAARETYSRAATNQLEIPDSAHAAFTAAAAAAAAAAAVTSIAAEIDASTTMMRLLLKTSVLAFVLLTASPHTFRHLEPASPSGQKCRELRVHTLVPQGEKA